MRVFDDTKERTGSGNKTLHPPPPPAPAWHPDPIYLIPSQLDPTPTRAILRDAGYTL